MKKWYYIGITILGVLAGILARRAYGGVPVKFTVETSRADIQEIPCYHGETLDFEVTMKNYGKNLNLPTNEPAQIFWQTNGMSAFYWRTNNVNIVSNMYFATFTPEMDPGTTTCFGFIGTPKEIYRASFVLRFKNSPGSEPKYMEWPYRELDYSKIEVLNAPWYDKEVVDQKDEAIEIKTVAATNAVIKEAEKRIEDATNRVPELVDYALTNKENVVIGKDAKSNDGNFGTVAIGNGSKVTEAMGVAIGYNDEATTGYAIGMWNYATNTFTTAIGEGNVAGGFNATAIGKENKAIGRESLAIGNNSEARSDNSIALGYRAIATNKNSVVITTGSGREDIWGNTYSAGEGTIKLAVENSDPKKIFIGKTNLYEMIKVTTPIANYIAEGTNKIEATGKWRREKKVGGLGKGYWEVNNEKLRANGEKWGDEINYVEWREEERAFSFSYGTAAGNINEENINLADGFEVNVEGTVFKYYGETQVEEVYLATTNELGRINGFPENAVVITNGLAKTKSGESVTAEEVGAYDVASGNTLAGQVATIGSYLNAEDARFIATNYNSSTKIAEAYVEVKQSNEWLKVWSEMVRWNKFTGEEFDWTAWGGFETWKTNVEKQVEEKSPREYAFYDGVTGEAAPDDYFWISQPHIAVCAGAAYQRYVEGGHEIWVLESNGLVSDINGTTNGYFRITDSEGDTQFEIVKGDKQTVFANANAMVMTNINGVSHFYTTYAVTNATAAPTAHISISGPADGFVEEDDENCPANVRWTKGENSYTLEWWPKQEYEKMFVKCDYERGGDTIIRNKAPVEMETIRIGGIKYEIGVTTINGEKVIKLTEAQ